MNLDQTSNLSSDDFIRMYERDAKTPLELALFSRLTDLADVEHKMYYQGGDGLESKMSALVGDIEDRMVTVENEIEEVITAIEDDEPAPTLGEMFKSLTAFSVDLEQARDKLRNTFDNEVATY